MNRIVTTSVNSVKPKGKRMNFSQQSVGGIPPKSGICVANEIPASLVNTPSPTRFLADRHPQPLIAAADPVVKTERFAVFASSIPRRNDNCSVSFLAGRFFFEIVFCSGISAMFYAVPESQTILWNVSECRLFLFGMSPCRRPGWWRFWLLCKTRGRRHRHQRYRVGEAEGGVRRFTGICAGAVKQGCQACRVG